MAAFDDLAQDLQGGIRGLLKSPGFAAASLVTLALGIGATAAIFSVVKAVLAAPLPYAEPDRRVMIWSRWISFDKTWLSNQEVVDYRTWRGRSRRLRPGLAGSKISRVMVRPFASAWVRSRQTPSTCSVAPR